jgi:pimeloyl-ACP methyl ester carboxylesterase
MPPTVHHLKTNGLAIAWARTRDDSPAPLLFLHGLGDSSIMTFTAIAQHPALGGRPSVLVDLPGFGHSTAPDDWPGTMEDHAVAVMALLDALEVEDVTIVAHSMGASLALLVASRRPGLFSRLVLAEPLLVREHSALAKAIARRTEDDFVARWRDMLLIATRRQAQRGDAAARSFLAPLRRAHPAMLHRGAVSLLADRSPSFLELIGALELPRTLLVGERTGVDLSILPEDVPLVRIPEAGHAMMSENPDAFARAIAKVVGGEPQRDAAAR